MTEAMLFELSIATVTPSQRMFILEDKYYPPLAKINKLVTRRFVKIRLHSKPVAAIHHCPTVFSEFNPRSFRFCEPEVDVVTLYRCFCRRLQTQMITEVSSAGQSSTR